MWRPLLLAAFVAAGVRAFAPATVRWRGISAKRFVLAPSGSPNRALVPPKAVVAPQFLAIWDQELPSTRPPNGLSYFTTQPDKTIAWHGTGLCIEANGDASGDTVSVNTCTGEPKQLWNVLPLGKGQTNQIQLKGTSECIHVHGKEGSLNGARVELETCDYLSSEAWEFEAPVPLPKKLSAHQHPLSYSMGEVAFLTGMVVWGALSMATWLWYGRKLSRALDGQGATNDEGGVSLTTRLAAFQNGPPSMSNSDERMALAARTVPQPPSPNWINAILEVNEASVVMAVSPMPVDGDAGVDAGHGNTSVRISPVVRGSPTSGSRLKKRRVIDSAVHVWPTWIDTVEEWPNPNAQPPVFKERDSPWFDKATDAMLLHANMVGEKEGGNEIVTSLIVQPALLGKDHSYVSTAMKRNEDVFQGMLLVHPNDVDLQNPNALESELRGPRFEAGYSGVRLNPMMFNGDEKGIEKMVQVYNVAGQLNLPVGIMAFNGFHEEVGDVKKILKAATDAGIMNDRLVIDHFGFFRQVDKTSTAGRLGQPPADLVHGTGAKGGYEEIQNRPGSEFAEADCPDIPESATNDHAFLKEYDQTWRSYRCKWLPSMAGARDGLVCDSSTARTNLKKFALRRNWPLWLTTLALKRLPKVADANMWEFVTVLDSAVSPNNNERAFQAVLDLASSEKKNVFVKLSAFFRVSKMEFPHPDLRPRVLALLDAFGSQNLCWGSDFPFVLTGGHQENGKFGVSSPSLASQIFDIWNLEYDTFGEALLIKDEDIEAMLQGTAERLFKL